MYDIVIRGKAECKDAVDKYGATHIISIQDAADIANPTRTPPGMDHRNHIHLFFDDLDIKDLESNGRKSTRYSGVQRDAFPTKRQIKQILEFAANVPEGSKLFVHCFAGVCRSTAAGFAILCQMLGPGKEQEAYDKMVKASIRPWPNDLIVQYADELLGRNTQMEKVDDLYKERQRVRIALIEKQGYTD